MTVTQTIYPEVLDRNWQVYQRLKLALKLGLRRQIFVAVCDDVSLQNLLAARLHADLTSNTPNVHAHRPAVASVAGCPGLISLRLNIRHPHPTAQIAKWLAKHSLAAADRLSREDIPLPNFQILGIEQLTRQPPSKQWSFLYSLRKLGNTPFAASLLFWLPRPWYHTVQQSVPEFWQCCTGIFEFDGDPTPCSFDMPADVARDRLSSLDPDANRAIADFQRVHPVHLRTDEVAERSNPEVAEVREAVREAEAIAGESVESLVESSAEDVATEPIRFIPPSLEQISGVAAPPVPPEIERESDRASDMPPDAFPPAELVALIQQYPDSDREAKQQVTQAIAVLEDLHHRQAAPGELAEAYLSLGDMCRDWLGDGDVNPATIQLAICAYDRAVQCMDAASPPSLPDGDRRAYILNDIGTLFWMLANSLTEVGAFRETPALKHGYLERAIAAYQGALAPLDPTQAAPTWIMIQNNLGAVASELARWGDRPAERWQQAVSAYQAALAYSTDLVDARATTQNNLGTAHWNLAQYAHPARNLKAAIAAYTEALAFYHPDTNALSYAMLQNNLGTAYWNLASYEDPETHLQAAIRAYRIALTYRTPEVHPTGCAATQNNLGTAYWHLAECHKGDTATRQEALQAAIAAYVAATDICQQLPAYTTLSFDRWSTHNNLGLAYYALAQEVLPAAVASGQGDKCDRLYLALHHHLKAWQGWQQQPELQQTAVHFILETMRTLYDTCGINGQNRALSQIPPELLPEILSKL